jgi:hypothetical protein
MSGLMAVLSYGIGTILGLIVVGLVVEEKYLRVANYAINMNKEIDMIAHSCGCRHARELRRERVRIVESAGRSIALNMLYPYPKTGREFRQRVVQTVT